MRKRDLEEFENEMFREPDFFDSDYERYLMGDYLQGRNDDTEDNDPQYNIFLDSLKQIGNSWVVQANERNGLPVCYTFEDGSDYELDKDTGKEMKNVRGANVEDVRSNSSSPDVFGSLPKNRRRTMVENDVKSDSSDPINPNTSEVDHCIDEELLTTSSYASDRQHNIDIQGQCAKECNCKILENNDDHDYLFFLNGYKFKDKEWAIESKNFCPTDGDTELQIVLPDNGTFAMKGNPRFPAHNGGPDVDGDDSCDCLGSPSGERESPFRELVIRILRKPYDKKEHQMLSGVMKARKPIERNMDLRFGREQSYSTNKDGKSYLDHYPDLRRKLEAADCRKELNLLRGFFFWLQNLTKEGAFRPWQDASCLAVQQQDR